MEEGVDRYLRLAHALGRFMTALSRPVRRRTAQLDERPARGELLGPEAQAALAPDARPRDADVLQGRGGVEVGDARELAHRRAPAPATLAGVEGGRLEHLGDGRAAVGPGEVDEHQVARLIGRAHERLALRGQAVRVADDRPRRRSEAVHDLQPVLHQMIDSESIIYSASWWRRRSRSSAKRRAS